MKKIKRRVAVLGEPTVGKTAMIEFYISNGSNFPRNYKMTQGCEIFSKLSEVDENDVELYFLDTSGRELYRSIVEKLIKDPHFVCLVYDSTNLETYRALGTWIDILKKANANKDFPGILMSTKNDLTSLTQVDSSEAREQARKWGMEFYEVSCNDYDMVEKAFLSLVHKTLAG